MVVIPDSTGVEILKAWKNKGYKESRRKPYLHNLGGMKCPIPRPHGTWASIKGDGCMPRCADHTSVWNKNGQMTAIVTQPYEMDEDDLGEIHKLCKETGTRVWVTNLLNWHYPVQGGVMSLLFQKDDERLHPTPR